MNIKFEKDKLLSSVISFDKNLIDIKDLSRLFIFNNDISSAHFDLDNISYLKQVSHFSKLKYINSNFEKIEERIYKEFESSEKTLNFYLKKINIIRNIPANLLSNLEILFFQLLISFKRAKNENNIKIIYDDLNLYSKRIRELCDIISDFSKSLSKDLDCKNNRYENLVLFQNPNFSCENFENIFKKISENVRNAFVNLNNNSKCIKIQHLESSSLKNFEFLSTVDSFLKNHFDFSTYFENKNSGKYFNYINFNDHNILNQEINLKDLLNIKIKNLTQNFIRNLSSKKESESDLEFLLNDFNSCQNFQLINDFILNFYSNSQFFVENLSQYLKKNSKIKGRSFETKNLFWILNAFDSEDFAGKNDLFMNNIYDSSGEVVSILFLMIQYVIEKDFINNAENLNLDDIIGAWREGMKYYFGFDVSPMSFVENFNFNPFECGNSGFRVFSILKSSTFFNRFFEESKASNIDENSILFDALSSIMDFEQKYLNKYSNEGNSLLVQSIFDEYKKYLKNKFGISF